MLFELGWQDFIHHQTLTCCAIRFPDLEIRANERYSLLAAFPQIQTEGLRTLQKSCLAYWWKKLGQIDWFAPVTHRKRKMQITEALGEIVNSKFSKGSKRMRLDRVPPKAWEVSP